MKCVQWRVAICYWVRRMFENFVLDQIPLQLHGSHCVILATFFFTGLLEKRSGNLLNSV